MRRCFNPRSPCGERPHSHLHRRFQGCFNPRSPCGERRRPSSPPLRWSCVSTHAPLAGSDGRFRATARWPSVSTHAPLAGSDQIIEHRTWRKSSFQPTLPLRGATSPGSTATAMRVSFNPRSPCGERPRRLAHTEGRLGVSTHAPLAGSDRAYGQGGRCRWVSTHAPLAGSDRWPRPWSCRGCAVSTHAPLAGSDRRSCRFPRRCSPFQPTHPWRGATTKDHIHRGKRHVSTHAPLAGSDAAGGEQMYAEGQFQPTLPLRGAT